MNLTGGTLLGDGDCYRARASAEVEDAAGAASAIHGLERGVHDALGVGAWDKGVLVELYPQVAEVGVAQDALDGLAFEAASRISAEVAASGTPALSSFLAAFRAS